jgi:heme/copper-type cytochrome/quinol oxidase subunit 2
MQKVDGRKAFAIAVFGGLIIGKLIKKFAVGLLLGVVLSLLYVLIRYPSAKKNRMANDTDRKEGSTGLWVFAYAGVVIFLFFLIVFFYQFTRFFE